MQQLVFMVAITDTINLRFCGVKCLEACQKPPMVVEIILDSGQ